MCERRGVPEGTKYTTRSSPLGATFMPRGKLMLLKDGLCLRLPLLRLLLTVGSSHWFIDACFTSLKFFFRLCQRRKSQSLKLFLDIMPLSGWPDWANFRPLRDFFHQAFFNYQSSQKFRTTFFRGNIYLLILIINWFGCITDEFVTNSSGHPVHIGIILLLLCNRERGVQT
jgi:hypothetical protein